MARYDASHKAKSHQALLSNAARLFRQRGYNGVGIDELCGAAGLTRGAFYAHFQSKAALFQAVIGGAHDLLKRLRARTARSPSALRQQGSKVALDYLDPVHRHKVVQGCSLAALAMDTARADPDTQHAYAETVSQIVDEFRRDNPDLPRDHAQAALALCIGGLLIGAACNKHSIGEQIARSARRQVRALLLGAHASTR